MFKYIILYLNKLFKQMHYGMSICNYLYYLKLQTSYFQDVSYRDSSRNEPCGVDVKMAETSLVCIPLVGLCLPAYNRNNLHEEAFSMRS